MTKIAMWSGPRSISTALMRSFENRPDTFVTDEPFYAHYLHKSDIDHPYCEEVMADALRTGTALQMKLLAPSPRARQSGTRSIWPSIIFLAVK